MTSNERFNELMKRIIKEYDKTGGNLALSGIEFARYFDVDEEIIPVLFNKMIATGRFTLRKEEDLDTGEEVERIQIHPDIKRFCCRGFFPGPGHKTNVPHHTGPATPLPDPWLQAI